MQEADEEKPRFAELLKRWRGDLPATEVDRQLQQRFGSDRIKDRYTSQVEHGRQRAPDEDVCRALGAIFGIDGEIIWRAAARDRMLVAGVLDFHDREVRAATRLASSGKVTDALLQQVQIAGSRMGDDRARFATSLVTLLQACNESESRMLERFSHALEMFDALDHVRQKARVDPTLGPQSESAAAECQDQMIRALDMAARAMAWNTGIKGAYWAVARRSDKPWGLARRVYTDDLRQHWIDALDEGSNDAAEE